MVRGFLTLWLTLTLLAGATPPAEQVTTPHWPWPEAANRWRVVFLVNAVATREPHELAQRFPLDATIVPVTGDAYANRFDAQALQAALATRPDAIVIAASNVWRDLPEDARASLRETVSAGVPLLVFQRHDPALAALPFPDLKLALWPQKLADEAAAQALYGKAALPRLYRARWGQGTVTLVTGYDHHGTFHTAFLPHNLTYDELPAIIEAAYAVAGRLILQAAGWQPTPGERRHRWYSRFGEPLGEGDAPPRPGIVFRQWWDASAGGLGDFGVALVETPLPVRLDGAAIAPDGLCRWQLAGAAAPDDQALAQVCDADGRLLAETAVPASASQVALTVPSLVTQTCRVRLLLRRGAQVLDEQRLPYTVAGPYAPMPVIVWGMQTGSLAERWQYPRLRQLGINALAVIGRRPQIAHAAASAGLRLVPTNIYVPTEATQKDPEPARQALAEYAAQLAPYRPLGYSLADEPGGSDPLAWLGEGAAIIRRHQAEARVGYCGVWLRPPMDVPAMLAASDFFEAYSPLHLYTPNLWLGAERDLMRSFRRRDGLLTAWTHYVTSYDWEPYARTVP